MIYGVRIRLRAPERSDIPKFVQWINDPEVLVGLQQVLPFSSVDEENWFDSMISRPMAEHILVIEYSLGDKWIPIGSLGFHNIDWRIRQAEIGIMIGEKLYWNKGFGSEAMELMIANGFKTLNFNRIALEVYETNPRAIHVYEKLGFVHEGRKRQGMYKDGRYIDVLMMSILRSEWEGRDIRMGVDHE
jgi:RimJ/RimL family protein N-acetyltransferase